MKNGKFEVGDIVAGKKIPREHYGITNHLMTRAKVIDAEANYMNVRILDHTDRRYIDRVFGVVNDQETFRLVGFGDNYPDSAVLVINRYGAELTADLAADGKITSAKAVCSPHDSFSIHAGIGLLLERLGFPKPAEQGETEDKVDSEPEPEPYKPQVGDLIRVTRLAPWANNGGLRVGDLARIVAFYQRDRDVLYVSCPKKSGYIGDGADRPVSGHVTLLDSGMYELIERQPDRW